MERQAFLVRVIWRTAENGESIFRAEVTQLATGKRMLCADEPSLLECLLAPPPEEATTVSEVPVTP